MGGIRLTLAFALPLVVACAGDEPSGLMVLDTSQRVIDPGQAVPLIAGPQGGYHAELLLTGQGLATGPATLDILATGQDDGVFSGRLPLRLKADSDLTITDHPVRLILCPGPLAIQGSALHFHWLVTDKQGAQLETELDLAPTCPAGDDACPNVCAASAR